MRRPMMPEHWPDDESGSILPMALVFIGGLAVVVLTFIGAQEGWTVRRNAQMTATSAARAAAYVEPVSWRAAQVPASGAVSRAESVLASQGYRGSVHLVGDEVIVTVDATIVHTFPMPWLPTTVRAVASADLVRGVDGTQE